MAMLHNPKIVFLDEPTIGLDVLAKDKIRDFILEMNKEGVTFILTTHDLSDVEHLAKRVIIINHGEIIFDNNIDNLKKYLGNNRIINLSTQNPIKNNFAIKGLKIIKKLSDYNIEFEIDIGILSLNDFISTISKTNIIKDLIVNDVPIENIIKDLYKS